jgi:hypothetical protein
VSADEADDFTASCGVSDVDGVPDIQMVGQRGKVVGVVAHVVTAAGLRGAAVPSAVMGDDAVAILKEKTASGCPTRQPKAASHG